MSDSDHHAFDPGRLRHLYDYVPQTPAEAVQHLTIVTRTLLRLAITEQGADYVQELYCIEQHRWDEEQAMLREEKRHAWREVYSAGEVAIKNQLGLVLLSSREADPRLDINVRRLWLQAPTERRDYWLLIISLQANTLEAEKLLQTVARANSFNMAAESLIRQQFPHIRYLQTRIIDERLYEQSVADGVISADPHETDV